MKKIFFTANEEKKEEFSEKLSNIHVEISQLSEESYQVAFTIAGYVAKQILKKINCNLCENKLISLAGNNHGSECLDISTHPVLIYLSQSLADFVAHAFSSLDIASDLISQYTSFTSTKILSEETLHNLVDQVYFSCEEHARVKKIVINIIINIFYNNKQKITTDSVRKQQVTDFITTDSVRKQQVTDFITTDSVRKQQVTDFITADSVRKQQVTDFITTDSVRKQQVTDFITTDSVRKQQVTDFITT